MPTLDFPSKDTVYGHHLTVPYHPIEVVKSKSVGNGDLDNNLIINADNLYALKALLPRYGGKVNCIYIDPPYNTGNGEWVYNDNVDSPKMREWLKNQNPVDGEDQERHDKWCCMMWPRLQLLKELLADDGVIFISIDDNEQANLKLIMDEIFGEDNFIACVPVISNLKGNNDKYGFSATHEYFLVFTKDKNNSRFYEFDVDEEDVLSDWEEDEYGFYKEGARLKFTGANASRKKQPELFFPIYVSKDYVRISIERKNPEDIEIIPITEGEEMSWRWSKKRIDAEPHNLMVHRGKHGELAIIKKQRPKIGDLPTKKPKSHFYKPEYSSGNGTREMKQIFGDGRIFPYPKSTALIKDILKVGCPPNGIVLDSFAGSGTTAQAVLELNKEDGGNRKFILVQMDEEKKENGKWVIKRIADKITAERVKRVIKGIPNAKDENLKRGLGGEFTFCTLGEELSEDGILIGEKIPSFATLAKHLFYSATGTSLPSGNHKNGFEWFIGERDNRHFYLIYKPDKKFLAATESALNQDLVERIIKHKTPQKRAIVYSTSKFIKQKELSGADITWCQLPFCLYGSPIPRVSKTPIEKEVAKK